MMKIACPHCSQHLELDSETLVALEGASHFDCPTCGGAVEVPTPVPVPAKQAPPTQKGKPTPERVARRTQQGINRNLLILGVMALLAIGGVALFLASKNGGNIFNTFQNITNEIINNSYFTQLIADGVTSKKDLESIAEIRPYGEGFIGISKEEFDWEQAQDLAGRTGAEVIVIEGGAAGSKQQLLEWVATTFKSHLTSNVWVRDGGETSVLAGSEILATNETDRQRKVLLHWQAADPVLTAATKDNPFINSLGMKFVPVPETSVLFCIHETRRQDYAVYAAEVPGVNDFWKNRTVFNIPVGGQDEHPVVLLSWEDSQAFCVWLSKKEGKSYRLPTDEEWSRAVGLGNEAGTTPKERSSTNSVDFPWGSGYPPPIAKVGNYRDTAFHEKFVNEKDPWVKAYIEGYVDDFATTAPVGSFTPNEYGIYDLGGNVWEWCADWYDIEQKYRVNRGACWGDYERYSLLSSHRYPAEPGIRGDGLGFRCVLEVRGGSITSQSVEGDSGAAVKGIVGSTR